MRILSLTSLLILLLSPLSGQAAIPPSLLEQAGNSFDKPKTTSWKPLLILSQPFPELNRLLRWKYYTLAESDAGFQEIREFIHQHPNWPAQDLLKKRAEEKLLGENLSNDTLMRWFRQHPPRTTQGKTREILLLHKGSTKSKKHAVQKLRTLWTTEWLPARDEKTLVNAMGRHLLHKHHAQRIDYLLWNNHPSAAGRLIKKLQNEEQSIAKARIALQTRSGGVDRRIRAIPAGARNHSGLVFDRIRWRANRGNWEGIATLLNNLPNTIPYPEKWWPYRQRLIREAIESGRYQKAYDLASNHRQRKGYGRAEALWLAGWVALEFLKQPEMAYPYFYELHHMASYPVSKSRGAFWAGRAAARNNNPEIRANWYRIASTYPTTFYGQLAHKILSKGSTILNPKKDPKNTASVKPAESDLADTVRLLVSFNALETARYFLTHMLEHADNEHDRRRVLALAKDMNQPYLSVKTAKAAAKYGIQDTTIAFPKVSFVSKGFPVDPAYAMAIARQESEFNPKARSGAGAMGLMQLMPRTAQQTAKKAGLQYRKTKLYEPAYNARLGTAYLAELLKKYDGSAILATAAYNAGPGRVNEWIRRFGKPGERVSVLNWIELIPFAETRNYVQRVLEGKTVYQLAAGKIPSALPVLLTMPDFQSRNKLVGIWDNLPYR